MDIASLIPIDTLVPALSEALGGDISDQLKDLEKLAEKAKELKSMSKETRSEELKKKREELAEKIEKEIEERKEELKKQLEKVKESIKKMIQSKIKEVQNYADELVTSTELIATSISTWTIQISTSIPLVTTSVAAAIDPGSKAGVLSSLPPMLTTIAQNVAALKPVIHSADGAVEKLNEGVEFITGLITMATPFVPVLIPVPGIIQTATKAVLLPYETVKATLSGITDLVSGAAEKAAQVANVAVEAAHESAIKNALDKCELSGGGYNFGLLDSEDKENIRKAFEYSSENGKGWSTKYRELYNYLYE